MEVTAWVKKEEGEERAFWGDCDKVIQKIRGNLEGRGLHRCSARS